MCEWRVGDRDPHYRELSTYLGVEERIGVLCVLPLDGSPRGVDSCTLHQRRSNRDRFRSPGFGPGSRGHSLSDVLAELEAEARRYVADARTLPEMSRALGQLPESCLASGDERRCEWVLSNGSAGHGAAVRLVGGDMQRKLRFACLFPPDAGPRRDGSCDGEAP
jgi:hypothetical protein